MNATVLKMPMTPAQRTLLLILALSLLPVAIGAGLYFYGWRPAQTSNRGTLIAPPVAMDRDDLKGKWSLALIGDSRCGAPCDARLDELRRVRVVLAREWQSTQHLRIDKLPPALHGLPAGSVVIVDPNGLAMMRYAPGAELADIRADFERLLKISWIG